MYECHKVEYAFTSPVRTEFGMPVMRYMQCCVSVSDVLQCVDVLSRGGTQMFAIVICLVLPMCTLTIRTYLLCVSIIECIPVVVNAMLSLMYVQPIVSHRRESMYFVCFDFRVSLVSRTVTMSACVSRISSPSSPSLSLSPSMLTCSMMRFPSPPPLGMCDCVVLVVLW